jgi:hypothetical protein
MTELAAGQPDLVPCDPCADGLAHHWLIGRQDGPSSEGICKNCGASRPFVNAYFKTYRTPIYLGRPRHLGPSPPPGPLPA